MHISTKAPTMEDLSADDDLLSDILIDHLAWGTNTISTHKMDPRYRSPRFDSIEATDIVHKYCVYSQDLPTAIEKVCNMAVVKRYLEHKSLKQRTAFQTHVRRYLECYLPDSGIEFALTMRYKQSPSVPLRSRRHRALLKGAGLIGEDADDKQSELTRQMRETGGDYRLRNKSKAKLGKLEEQQHQQEEKVPMEQGSSSVAPVTAAVETAAAEPDAEAGPSDLSSAAARKGAERSSMISLADVPSIMPPGTSPSSSLLAKADLCVLAVRAFKPGEILTCKAGIADLTPEEDEALREEAAQHRTAKNVMSESTGDATATTAATATAVEQALREQEGEAVPAESETRSAKKISRADRKYKYKGILGAGRDFSVVRSARKGCSQLFLGPARFVNHDCEPNVEFYRMGQQMAFRCIRPIAINEEIVTYYGDNYFEVDNARCLCATCESRGEGAFTPASNSVSPAPDGSSAAIQRGASHDTNGFGSMMKTESNSSSNGGGRRSFPRAAQYTAPYAYVPRAASDDSFLADGPLHNPTSVKDGHNSRKLLDEPVALLPSAGGGNRGPERECVTCSAHFWSEETWWVQEECHRCDRHFQIFKADWPERVPSEPYAPKSKEKPFSKMDAKSGRVSTGADKKGAEGNGRQRITTSETSSSFDSSSMSSMDGTPVVLTPLREISDGELQKTPKKRKPNGRKSDKGGATPTASTTPMGGSSEAKRPQNKRGRSSTERRTQVSSVQASRAQNGMDDDGSDLSDLSSLSSAPSSEDEGGEEETGQDKRVVPETRENASTPAEAVEPVAKAEASSSGSSVSSESDCAVPKILGSAAKTDVLAHYWGAQGDRQSRASRKSAISISNGARPVTTSSGRRITSHTDRSVSVMSASSGKIGNQSPRRASAVATAAASSGSPGPARKKRIVESDDSDSGLTDGADDTLAESSTAVKNPTARVAQEETRRSSTSSSERSEIPGLAKDGPARTSEHNLSLAWSAGSSGGKRAVRSAVPRPMTVAVPRQAKVVKKRTRSQRDGSTDSRSHRAPSSAEEEGSETPETRPVPQLRKSRSEAELLHAHLDRACSPQSAGTESAPPEGSLVLPVGPTDNQFKYEPDKSPLDTDDGGDGEDGDRAGGSGAGGNGHVRNGSSSTYPTLAIHPGVEAAAVSGQVRPPPRKNLRWGKSKTTQSRPPPLGGGIPAGGFGAKHSATPPVLPTEGSPAESLLPPLGGNSPVAGCGPSPVPGPLPQSIDVKLEAPESPIVPATSMQEPLPAAISMPLTADQTTSG